jgi:hypothetical protein
MGTTFGYTQAPAVIPFQDAGVGFGQEQTMTGTISSGGTQKSQAFGRSAAFVQRPD